MCRITFFGGHSLWVTMYSKSIAIYKGYNLWLKRSNFADLSCNFIIRAGRVMPGVSTPPPEIFFRNYPPLKASGYTCSQKPYPGTLFRPFRCIRQHLAIARCIQVYPGVSQKKFFRPKAGKIFFDRVSRPPPEKFFSQKKIFFFTLISIHVRVRKIVSLQFKTSTFSL